MKLLRESWAKDFVPPQRILKQSLVWPVFINDDDVWIAGRHLVPSAHYKGLTFRSNGEYLKEDYDLRGNVQAMWASYIAAQYKNPNTQSPIFSLAGVDERFAITRVYTTRSQSEVSITQQELIVNPNGQIIMPYLKHIDDWVYTISTHHFYVKFNHPIEGRLNDKHTVQYWGFACMENVRIE